MARPSQTDWNLLETEYVHGQFTMLQLAERHGVNYQYVRTKAAEHRWTEKREEAQQLVAQKVAESIAGTRVAQARSANNEDLEIAGRIKQVCQRVLGRMLKPLSPKELEELQRNPDDAERYVDVMELRGVSLAAVHAQRIARLALGLTTDNPGLYGSEGETRDRPLTPKEVWDQMAALSSAPASDERSPPPAN